MRFEGRKAEVQTAAAAAEGVGSGDVKGQIVAPSVFNKSWVRAAALALAVVAAARSTTLVPGNLSSFAHIAAFGLWFGASVWVSFIASLTMFKNMKRQDFGRIQAKLFPKYFAWSSAAIIILMSTVQYKSRPWLLIAALVATMANWLIIEPTASGVLMERYDLESSAADDPETKDKVQGLYKRFSKLHGISSLLNLVSVCGAFAYAWWLGGAANLAVLV